jgi:hypothetical protein
MLSSLAASMCYVSNLGFMEGWLSATIYCYCVFPTLSQEISWNDAEEQFCTWFLTQTYTVEPSVHNAVHSCVSFFCVCCTLGLIDDLQAHHCSPWWTVWYLGIYVFCSILTFFTTYFLTYVHMTVPLVREYTWSHEALPFPMWGLRRIRYLCMYYRQFIVLHLTVVWRGHKLP